MPTFVPNGIFVPDRLVQELEDDRVVIFCGAGISMGAGLPSYTGLVEHCYNELGVPLPKKRSIEWQWPDRMLGALESRFPVEMRRVVAGRLDRDPTDIEMHRAILNLAGLRGGNGIRLVTTNYDTFFEHAQSGLILGQDYHSGPVLPIPRNDRIVSWKSIVYLHGRLASATEANDHLVLTSADFGRAYLTDAWAARFVARLFSEFTVLFIGYSLNDPVLRYMTDAFAAEEISSRGRARRSPAYIFVPYRGREAQDPQPWRERKIEPIFYNQMRNHVQLKRTLIGWAKARHDYLSRTRVMISRTAPHPPESQHPSDVANLVWAIAGRPDDEGYGARIFASLDPPPAIEWLSVLSRHEERLFKQYREAVDVARQEGVEYPAVPTLHLDELFPMSNNDFAQIGQTARALIPWITAQLGSFQLTEWVIERLGDGRRANWILRQAIRSRLAEESALGAGFVRFWRIISAEGEWSHMRPNSFLQYGPGAMLRDEPDTPWATQELAAVLRPVLTLKRSFYRRFYKDNEADGRQLAHIADAKVKLRGEDYIDSFMEALAKQPHSSEFLAARIDVLTEMLREALSLYEIAGEANSEFDPTIIQRPSIEPHSQNRNYERWTILFDLIWQGWRHIDLSDGTHSRECVARWRRIPYLGFRRLSIAAVNASGHFTPEEKIEVLLNA